MPIFALPPADVIVGPSPMSFVDQRDTLGRLARVHVTGTLAQEWLLVLDPVLVREISDPDLAVVVGGTYAGNALYPYPGLYPNGSLAPSAGGFPPPPIPDGNGAWGSGTWGSGPWGG